MKFRNIKFISLFVVTLIILIGCSTKTDDKINSDNNSPQVVVENYFKYYNEKNKDGVISTLTGWHDAPNVVWDFDNLESIRILNIEEEKNEDILNGYLMDGRGSVNGASKENVKIYKVNYEVKYKTDGVGPQASGTYEWWYFLIREDENSPWLIDDMGV